MTIQSEQQQFANAIRRTINGIFGEYYREVVTGKLNDDGTVTLADSDLNPNQMYCRATYNSLVPIVVWGRVSKVNIDILVFRRGTEWQYFSPNYRKAGVSVGAELAAAVSTPITGGAASVIWPGERLGPGIVYKSDVGGLYVYLSPHFYLRHGVYTYFGGEDIDLSASVPGSGLQRWALVCIDPDTGAAAVLDGATLSTDLELTKAAIADISIGDYLPRYAIRVYNGQTTVMERSSDVADARLWLDGSIPTYKNNLTASADPTTGDDENDGYTVGSLWLNTTTPQVFFCSDATATSAVWNALN